MAAIDKTYVNAKEFKQAYDWCKKIGEVTLPNSRVFSPMAFLKSYNNVDDPEFNWNRDIYVLWNTPMWFDRWLWRECPLVFVRDRLCDQYDDDSLNEFDNWSYDDPFNNLDFGMQHYTFIKTPVGPAYKYLQRKARVKNPWPGNCKQLTYFITIVPMDSNNIYDEMAYDEFTDSWYKYGDMPTTGEYVWQMYHKNPPTKKSILRQLRKWYIPRGYKVKVYNLRYYGMDYEIIVR